MRTIEAREMGNQIALCLSEAGTLEAYQILLPVLKEHTPFRVLDIIGNRIGQEQDDRVHPLLQRIAADQTMGGWIVIASALQEQAKTDLSAALDRCCSYVIQADVWYAADSFGERVPGHTLVNQFDGTIEIIANWRTHPNRWIRRMVGVSVHYWAKQAHGDSACSSKVETLLQLFEPMFSERQLDAAKGVGWGLKTLGKYYPALLSGWLLHQAERPHREIITRKATKFLTEAR